MDERINIKVIKTISKNKSSRYCQGSVLKASISADKKIYTLNYLHISKNLLV